MGRGVVQRACDWEVGVWLSIGIWIRCGEEDTHWPYARRPPLLACAQGHTVQYCSSHPVSLGRVRARGAWVSRGLGG